MDVITTVKVDRAARYERLVALLDRLNLAGRDSMVAGRTRNEARRLAVDAMTTEERRGVMGL